MQGQVSLSSVFAFLRNVGSIASIVIGAAGTGGLPPAVRAVLVAIGGVLQGIEHLGSSTPAPAPPIASTTAPRTAGAVAPPAPPA